MTSSPRSLSLFVIWHFVLNASCISSSLLLGSLSHYVMTYPSPETSSYLKIGLFHLWLSETLYRTALNNLSWTLVSDDTFHKGTQKNYWSLPTLLEIEKGAWSAGPCRKCWNDKRKNSQASMEQRFGPHPNSTMKPSLKRQRNNTSTTILNLPEQQRNKKDESEEKPEV